MISSKERININRFICINGDLLKNEYVKSMKKYNHHGKISTHFHSVYVAYTVMKICDSLNIDSDDIVRAALLHDFYLYDWHTDKHSEKHAWYHPKASVRNIEEYLFPLSDMQRDMILCHMWPLHPAPPKYTGGWILTLADKHCANEDVLGTSKKFREIYDEINSIAEKQCEYV
ncbi:MAG: HD domain-containing protein [Eubacterium sp.]